MHMFLAKKRSSIESVAWLLQLAFSRNGRWLSSNLFASGRWSRCCRRRHAWAAPWPNCSACWSSCAWARRSATGAPTRRRRRRWTRPRPRRWWPARSRNCWPADWPGSRRPRRPRPSSGWRSSSVRSASRHLCSSTRRNCPTTSCCTSTWWKWRCFHANRNELSPLRRSTSLV